LTCPLGPLPAPPLPPVLVPGLGLLPAPRALDLLAPPLAPEEAVYLNQLLELTAALTGLSQVRGRRIRRGERGRHLQPGNLPRLTPRHPDWRAGRPRQPSACKDPPAHHQPHRAAPGASGGAVHCGDWRPQPQRRGRFLRGRDHGPPSSPGQPRGRSARDRSYAVLLVGAGRGPPVVVASTVRYGQMLESCPPPLARSFPRSFLRSQQLCWTSWPRAKPSVPGCLLTFYSHSCPV